MRLVQRRMAPALLKDKVLAAAVDSAYYDAAHDMKIGLENALAIASERPSPGRGASRPSKP